MFLKVSKKTLFLYLILIILGINSSVLQAVSDKCLIRITVNNNEIANVVNSFKASNEDIALIHMNEIDLVIKKNRLSEFEEKFETLILVWDDPKDRDNFEEYTTYYEMLELMEQLQTENPDIFKMYDIGNGWEKENGITGGDRDIWAIKISDNVEIEEADEEDVLLGFTIHAREIITPEIAKALMLNIINGYNDNDPMMQYFVNERETWIIPFQNPDGHNEVMTGDTWHRKNMNPTNGGLGIDLNRNFGFQWGYDNSGSSPDPTSDTYRGPSAFSEPETQAVRDFALEHEFELTISFHSYSRLHVFPWGYHSAAPVDYDLYMTLSDSMAIHSGYTSGQTGALLYPVNGDYTDWFYGDTEDKRRALAWTTEVGTTFHPPASQINSLVNENIPGIYFLLRQANDPYDLSPELLNSIPDQLDNSIPFTFTAEFQNSSSLASLDSARFYYKLPSSDDYESFLMTQMASNNFQAEFPVTGITGRVDYYYNIYFEDDVAVREVNYPRYAQFEANYFMLGPDTFAPEAGILSGSTASLSEEMNLDLQIFDSNEIDFVRGIYTIDGVVDSVEMTLASRDRELIEYHYLATLPAQHQEIIGSIYFRMGDDQNNIGISENFDIAWELFIIEDFETGDFTQFPWSFSGNSDWIIDNTVYFEGNFSAKSGSITHDQVSSIEIDYEVPEDGSDLTFYYKVSSESGYDYLRFYVDGEEIESWAGEESWNQFNDYINGGNHTLKWSYEKDGSVNSGSDCAWIDFIRFPLALTGIDDNYELEITNYELKQNYPNPFNPVTKINYELRITNYESAEIVVYNAIGQKVWSSPVMCQMAGGQISPPRIRYGSPAAGFVLFNGSSFNSGIYYYSLVVDGKRMSTKSMVLIK